MIVDASHDARDDATTRATTRTTREIPPRAHRPIIARRTRASSRRHVVLIPRDDCARARELNEFPPPSTPRRRARVATTRDTRRTKYSSRHERARARITDRIAPYLDRWRGPPTISVTAVPRVRARGPRRTTARDGSRPIGEPTANGRNKKSPRARLASRASPRPRDARARVVPNCRTFHARARGGCTTKGTQW